MFAAPSLVGVSVTLGVAVNGLSKVTVICSPEASGFRTVLVPDV